MLHTMQADCRLADARFLKLTALRSIPVLLLMLYTYWIPGGMVPTNLLLEKSSTLMPGRLYIFSVRVPVAAVAI